MPIRWKIVIRDAALLWALTFFGGYVANRGGALMNYDLETRLWILGLASVVLLAGGFFAVGCIARERRFIHGLLVAAGVWIAGFLNLVFLGGSIITWILQGPMILVCMLTGTGLSYLAVKGRKPTKEAGSPVMGNE